MSYELADIYTDLRGQALGLDGESLAPRNGLFALLMETGYDAAAVSVIATADGSASIYFSNGGGIIGAGEYEQVREVVFDTLTQAESFVDGFEAAAEHPLPQPGESRFYAVTEAGVVTAAAPEDDLGNERHALSPLFLQFHKLIAWIRAAEEHRSGEHGE